MILLNRASYSSLSTLWLVWFIASLLWRPPPAPPPPWRRSRHHPGAGVGAPSPGVWGERHLRGAQQVPVLRGRPHTRGRLWCAQQGHQVGAAAAAVALCMHSCMRGICVAVSCMRGCMRSSMFGCIMFCVAACVARCMIVCMVVCVAVCMLGLIQNRQVGFVRRLFKRCYFNSEQWNGLFSCRVFPMCCGYKSSPITSPDANTDYELIIIAIMILSLKE